MYTQVSVCVFDSAWNVQKMTDYAKFFSFFSFFCYAKKKQELGRDVCVLGWGGAIYFISLKGCMYVCVCVKFAHACIQVNIEIHRFIFLKILLQVTCFTSFVFLKKCVRYANTSDNERDVGIIHHKKMFSAL